MQIFRYFILFVSFTFSSLLLAHGPTPKKAKESVLIAAPPEIVWDKIKDFDNISQWHPLIVESTGDGANKPGSSERTLTLKGGGQIIEGLDVYEDEGREYGYRLSKENIEAFPVSFYTATIKVSPAEAGKSLVEWKGRYYRGDTGNFPPEHLNDEAAIEAMNEHITTGLKNLREWVEKKPGKHK